jgi:hypothetical protein
MMMMASNILEATAMNYFGCYSSFYLERLKETIKIFHVIVKIFLKQHSYQYNILAAMAWIGRVEILLPLHPPYAFIGMDMENVLLLYVVVWGFLNCDAVNMLLKAIRPRLFQHFDQADVKKLNYI